MGRLMENLKGTDLPRAEKGLIWDVVVFTFIGCFSIHKLLVLKERKYDPLLTPMERDVTLKEVGVDVTNMEMLEVQEESRKSSVMVELFTNATKTCLWRKISKLKGKGTKTLCLNVLFRRECR